MLSFLYITYDGACLRMFVNTRLAYFLYMSFVQQKPGNVYFVLVIKSGFVMARLCELLHRFITASLHWLVGVMRALKQDLPGLFRVFVVLVMDV